MSAVFRIISEVKYFAASGESKSNFSLLLQNVISARRKWNKLHPPETTVLITERELPMPFLLPQI